MKTTFELIYDVVRRIPRGCVATYGQVAALAGNPRWSRVVANPVMGAEILRQGKIVLSWTLLFPEVTLKT